MSMYGTSSSRPVVNTGPGRTKQAHKDECDVNQILKRYRATGQLHHVSKFTGVYADVSEVTDFREAVDRVEKAKEVFAGLSSRVRKHFGNSPAAFLDAATDPSRREELKELGLLKLQEKASEASGGSEGGSGGPAAPVPD